MSFVACLELPTEQDAPQQPPSIPRYVDVAGVWEVTSMSLGIGIFTIPYVIVTLGVVQGAVWLLVFSLLANSGMQRLLDVAEMHGVVTYAECADRAFGKCGKFFLMFVQFVTPFVGTLSYLSSCRGLLEQAGVALLLDFDVNTVDGGVVIMSDTNWRNILVFAIQLGAFLPMCVSTDISALSGIGKTAVLTAVTSTIYFGIFCIVLLARGCGSEALCGEKPPMVLGGDLSSLPRYLPTLAFSFSMVWSLFPCLEARMKSHGDLSVAVSIMRPVARYSVGLCCFCYLVIGILGSLLLGKGVKSFALYNLRMTNPLTLLISLLVGVAMTRICCMIALPLFQTLEVALSSMFGKERFMSMRNWVVFAMGVIFLVVDTYLPTDIAFALTGSLGLSSAAYIMPSLFFMKLGGDRRYGITGAVSIACVALGSFLFFVSTPVTVIDLLQGSSSSPGIPVHTAICNAEPLSLSAWAGVVV